MDDRLAEFIRPRSEQAKNAPLDWQAKKDAWLGSVAALYRTIRDMLADAIAAGDVSFRQYDFDVTEDLVGTYSVPVLELTIGREQVAFLPKAITVVGASGRVDVRGARDSVTLVHRHGEANPWSVILQRVPHLRMAPLDKESLSEALERAMLPLR